MHAEAIAMVMATKHIIDTAAEIVRTFSQHVIVGLSGQGICLWRRYYIVYKFELVSQMLLPLLVATLGHAAWDNVLHWMIVNDPDSSVLHMHWLRMVIVYIFLFFIPAEPPEEKTIVWWFQFSMFGWTLPALAYTASVMFTGYRIAVSFQPFIPLIVAWRIGQPLEGRRLLALNLAMLGTLSVWLWAPWYHKDTELWKIWAAICCSALQVVTLSKWFTMIPSKNPLQYIKRGVLYSIVTLFVVMIVWTPQHLAGAFATHLDQWFVVLLAGGIAAACKNWIIAYCSAEMLPDAVAIFECLHPVATLCSDILLGKDVFEYEDIITILLLALGWILYPKMNIYLP